MLVFGYLTFEFFFLVFFGQFWFAVEGRLDLGGFGSFWSRFGAGPGSLLFPHSGVEELQDGGDPLRCVLVAVPLHADHGVEDVKRLLAVLKVKFENSKNLEKRRRNAQNFA